MLPQRAPSHNSWVALLITVMLTSVKVRVDVQITDMDDVENSLANLLAKAQPLTL